MLVESAVLLNDLALSDKRGKGNGARGDKHQDSKQGHLLLNSDLQRSQNVDDVEVAVGYRDKDHPLIGID